MGSDRYCLRWNNHQNNLLGVFSQLLQEESLVDVTLACSEGHSIRAHKVVLSACSSYFQSLFLDHPNRHPIIILKDVCFAELRTLIEFMYRGEVNLDYCQLPTFLKTAKSLQVKGLTEMTHLRSNQSPDRDIFHSVDRQTPGVELPSTVIATNTNVATAATVSHEPLPLIRRRSRSPSDTDTSDKIPAEIVPQITQQSSPRASASITASSPARSTGTVGFETSQSHSPSSRLPTSVSPHLADTSSICDDQRSMTPDPDDDTSSMHSGPSDMTIGSQIPSPQYLKAVAGPSTLPPEQQVPLSLKKEPNTTSWDKSEEKNSSGNSGSDFSINRHLTESGLSSIESLYRLPQGTAPNFLMPPATSAATSSPSLDQLSSTSRSPTPFMFSPFHTLPVLPPPFLTSDLYTIFRQHGLMASAATGAYSSPSDVPQRSFIKCAICLAGFPTGWLLEQHTLLQHSGEPLRRHSSADSGLSSSSSSKEEKPFQCDQCGQSYRYRSAYIKHREQNHRARLPADKLFTCDICGMQFRYLKSFKKHRLNHTLEMLQPTVGGAIVAHRKESKQTTTHSDSSRNTGGGEQPTVVSESQVSSSNEVEPQSSASSASVTAKEEPVDSLAVALTNTEPTLFNLLRYPSERQRERQLFACSFCSKTVRSKENLKLHVRKHTGERPFACLFCGRAFGGKSDLTRHVRIHTGERPYHCEMCGKCFARADYLSKHLTTHLHNSHNARATTTSD